MALIRDGDTDPVKRKVVKHIVRMLEDLEIEVICKGVETTATYVQPDARRNVGLNVGREHTRPAQPRKNKALISYLAVHGVVREPCSNAFTVKQAFTGKKSELDVEFSPTSTENGLIDSDNCQKRHQLRQGIF